MKIKSKVQSNSGLVCKVYEAFALAALIKFKTKYCNQ